MAQLYKIMHQIVALKVSRNLATRLPVVVTIGIFDNDGSMQMSFNLPGELFPDDVNENDELLFKRRNDEV